MAIPYGDEGKQEEEEEDEDAGLGSVCQQSIVTGSRRPGGYRWLPDGSQMLQWLQWLRLASRGAKPRRHGAWRGYLMTGEIPGDVPDKPL